jgi:hypothetical protein
VGSFKKGRAKTGGRRKGKANKINVDTHRAILQAPDQVGRDISKTVVRDGLVAFIIAAVKQDLGRGIKLIQSITPRMLDVTVEKTSTIRYRTIEEVQEDLEKRGIKSFGEIFRIDYVGDQTKIEPVEAEILPPKLKQDPQSGAVERA